MSKEPRAFARRGVQALTVAAVTAATGAVFASPAYAAVPAITTVFVAGSTTNKVVTAGTTIEITGTGFSGMVDNAADSGCNGTAVAYPAAGSGCSQVRFVGASNGITLATRYNVISDTKIVASVPTIDPGTGTASGNPALGTGSVRVQVINTTATGIASGVSASTTSEVFYRAPLVANYNGTVAANPTGGGVLTVPITANSTSGLPSGTTLATFANEKVTAYLYSTVAGSPSVAATPVAFKTASSVDVTLPPGTPAGNLVGIMLLHDGIPGTADANSLSYPAVITRVNSCTGTALTAATTWMTAYAANPTTVSATLPDCTGSANVSNTAADVNYVKVTGKGFTGATAWSVDGGTTADDGTDNNLAVTEVCRVVSDTVALCSLTNDDVDGAPAGVTAMTFTPADPAGAQDAAALVPTGGSILIWNTLI